MQGVFSAEISRWKRRRADAAFHHGRQLAKVPEPWPAAVPWHHIRSLSRSPTAESRLRRPEWCCQGDMHEDEPSVHRLLCGKDSTGFTKTNILCVWSSYFVSVSLCTCSHCFLSSVLGFVSGYMFWYTDGPIQEKLLVSICSLIRVLVAICKGLWAV